MKIALLALVVLAAGCSGYQCDGPACPTDAALDAGVDAGVRRGCGPQRCFPQCCDEATGQCSNLSDARCGAEGSDFCVACASGQRCGPYLSSGRCM